MGVQSYEPLAAISIISKDGLIQGREVQDVDCEASEPNSTLQDSNLSLTNEGDEVQESRVK